ncbi:galactose-1-phosphate uridylyltransferase [Trichloromonas sp.]|uniref:galactose-1-phosphate uridylyltransferase n=1 Tax=Trichloromonas sp. TaxID=3069249 RepID=UPI003D8174FC
MSELRWDPLKMTWVIIANERGRRPRDFMLEREKVHLSACPFCAGNEAKTPRELFAVRPGGSAANGPGWKVRAIPNKYPILRIEGDLDKKGYGHYDTINGIGAHEVIIETPDHERNLADLTAAEISDVLKAYRARLLDLRKDSRFRYILIFKNHGIEAGANIPHSHSQVIAVPVTPTVVASKLSVCREYYERKERCLICDLIEQERHDGRGIVRDDGDFVVFAPFASCYPFELRIAPLRHGHDFGLMDDAGLARLAETLKDTLLRLRSVLRDPPYNFVLHNAPPMHLRLGKPGYWSSLPYDYHWHIELVPRLTRIAGFEWGTGFYMNPTPPEDAARFLREADLSVLR